VRSTTVRPINSLLFISDGHRGDVPIIENREPVVSNRSCVSFICFPEQDGPTRVARGATAEIDPGGMPVFNGEIETPTRRLIIWTVDDQTILEAAVPNARTHLRIWMDDLRWPERVVVGYE
jgi:hypothetical protein